MIGDKMPLYYIWKDQNNPSKVGSRGVHGLGQLKLDLGKIVP